MRKANLLKMMRKPGKSDSQNPVKLLYIKQFSEERLVVEVLVVI